MWDPDEDEAHSSFTAPADDPGTEPDAAPLICISVNASWLSLLAGCAMQLCQPLAWNTTDPVLLADLLSRAQILVNLIGLASACQVIERGVVDVTIPAGYGKGETVVTFPTPYSAAPTVVVGTDNYQLNPSWASVSDTGFTAELSVNVPQRADITAQVSWLAIS